MYHIFAAQCQRQDNARRCEYHPLWTSSTDAPRLVETLAPVLARIGGVEKEMNLPGSSSCLDAFRAIDQIARARLHPETVKSGLAKCSFSPFAKIGRDCERTGLEGALKRTPQLSVGIGGIEVGPAYSDPRAAAGSPSPGVWSDNSVWPER